MTQCRPLFLLARAPDQVDMAIFDSLIQEVEAKARRQEQGSSSSDDGEVQGQGRDLRSGWQRQAPDAEEDDAQSAASASPWGRRRLGDEWYEVRCIRCSACQRPVSATVRGKRAQRCAGCLRWYHDACVPNGTLPASKALRECDPTTSDFFCSPECSTARASLVSHATSALGPGCKALKDGGSFCLIDCLALRQHLNPGPYNSLASSSTEAAGTPSDKQLRASTSEPFKRIAREDLRVMKRLGQAPSGLLPTGQEQQQPDEVEGEGGAAQALSHARVVRSGLANLKAVVKIFNTFDKSETDKDLLQDSWVALLRAGDGSPVSAASLLVFGQDHARLQGMVTAPPERRRGHARQLVSELQAWLHAAGVPRMVAVLPERRTVGGGHQAEPDGEGVLRKLGFTTLQDLDVLGAWKEVHFPYYTRELLGRRPRVLLKPTAAGSRGGWPW